MKKRIKCAISISIVVILILIIGFFSVKARFPRKYREIAEKSTVDPLLVYSVMKAESGFRENTVSRAGAIGVMQLLPSTAEFICERENIAFDENRLFEGEYNVRLGTLYLEYLLEKFPAVETALAAYNAGEGTVAKWLEVSQYSSDGMTLTDIPYSETRAYVKKVIKFRKFYQFFY